jgi:hypothetical protein
MTDAALVSATNSAAGTSCSSNLAIQIKQGDTYVVRSTKEQVVMVVVSGQLIQ